MWEAIKANRRRSVVLITVMGILLCLLGANIGAFFGAIYKEPPVDRQSAILIGTAIGVAGALLLWLILYLVAIFAGERIILAAAGARKISKLEHPLLWNVVEEMKIASGLETMPGVYLVDDSGPNAFAVGRNPERAAVAVSSGLLRLMNRDELQGVVAHEIAHIRNLDIQFMTLAAVCVGSVELLSRSVLQVGPFTSGGRRFGNSRSGKNQYLLYIALAMAVISPILVRLLYLACSRQREYLADASAARFTRYPEGLASALEKIAVYHSKLATRGLRSAIVPLYIVNPVESLSFRSWSSTHPPTDSRVKILRSMDGGAGYVDYQAAMERIEGRKRRLVALDAAAKREGHIDARAASPVTREAATPVERAREVTDLVDRLANFIFIPCACGVRLKIPPDFKRLGLHCPRCGTGHIVPKAEPAKAGLAAPEASVPQIAADGAGELQFTRQSEDWEAFRCVCGQTIRLGPSFPLTHTECATCNRRIRVVPFKGSTEESPVDRFA
jgi:heat shock protein HtpX